jgi:pyruvate formate lyase activating enzyme
VALDVKSSFEKYPEAAGVTVNIEDIKTSIAILQESHLDHVFRTTAVPGLVDGEDIKKISLELEGSKMLRIQQYVPNNTLASEYQEIKPYPTAKLRSWVEIAEPHFAEVQLEGV